MTNETLASKNVNEVPPMPPYFVGRQMVNDRVKRFMNGKYRLLSDDMNNKGIASGESKHVWYPKKYLEMLLEEMERYAANGLRIYFGEYGTGPEELAPGQLGLLLVLTHVQGDGKTHDLIFEEQEDYNIRANTTLSRGIDFTLETKSGLPREFNAMLPCPPLCTSNDVPAFPEEDLS